MGGDGTHTATAQSHGGHSDDNMFSIFSKSVKTCPDHHHLHLHGPPGEQIDSNPAHELNITADNITTAMEVRSNINFQTNNVHHRHYNKYRDRRRGKNKNFRFFGSDCEDEITSVVSDNPQLYHRSASMVSIHN